jgi:uroporphyrinogen decarboxylase
MVYFDQIYFPYEKAIPNEISSLSEALADVMWSVPTPPNLGEVTLSELTEGAKKLRESTDKYIVYVLGGNLLENCSFLCSISEFMMLMGSDPDKTHRFLDRIVELHKKNIETVVAALSPNIDTILFSEDLGMQLGPLISPQMYREYLKPRHKELWQYTKEISGKAVQLHSCGGVRPLLNDFIDAGLDALNPIQISAAGMDARELKQEFGNRLCLWGGGCDTQHILPNGTPEEVRTHVLKQCEILQPNGGFVFQQIHNIQADVPPENIVAMFDAVAEFNGIK